MALFGRARYMSLRNAGHGPLVGRGTLCGHQELPQPPPLAAVPGQLQPAPFGHWAACTAASLPFGTVGSAQTPVDMQRSSHLADQAVSYMF